MHRYGATRCWMSLIGAAGLAFLTAGITLAATSGTWSETGSMQAPRVYQSATRLANGAVLVAGGYFFTYSPSPQPVDQATAEIYTPATGTFASTGPMAVARHSHTATLLPNGQVLVAGGCCDASGNDIASAELYNPATGEFTTTGSMLSPREDQIAVLLHNGTVLVAGGGIDESTATTKAELYDPATGTWHATGSMHVARQAFAAVLLHNGTVLVAGGESCFTCSSTNAAELYNPATGTWSLTHPMVMARSFHTLTGLPSGQVLAAGGCNGKCATALTNITSTAELWSPTTQTWRATGSMSIPRIWHTATLLTRGLNSGQVLIAGGETTTRQPVATSELYNPATGIWSITGSLHTARQLHTATLLPDGQVLVTGGFGPPLSFGSQATNTAELYQP